jgi:DNA-binding MarR family transcriptional regulator
MYRIAMKMAQAGRRAPRDRQPTADQYRMLAEFRYLIRCFLEFSERAARTGGLTPAQHQGLLAVKGCAETNGPTIGELAGRLRIRHHSAVELADRLAQAGLVERRPDAADRRRVRLALTEAAERRLSELSAIHLDELRRLHPALLQILERTGDGSGSPKGSLDSDRARPPTDFG